MVLYGADICGLPQKHCIIARYWNESAKPKMQDISWAACLTCSYADGWGHMQTRCHTTVSLHPKRPSTIGSVDFPVGQDTSSLLGQTNNRLSSHCVCVRARITECGFSALNDVCECIFGNGGICRTNNKTFVHACAEVHTCSGVLLPQCVRVCYYHPLCWSVLSAVSSPDCCS